MTNREIIREYINGTRTANACNHLAYHRDTLINYSTELCVIDREWKTAVVNCSKYSQTTSKIQGTLKAELTAMGYSITECEGEPAYAWNWGYQGARNLTMKDAWGI